MATQGHPRSQSSVPIAHLYGLIVIAKFPRYDSLLAKSPTTGGQPHFDGIIQGKPLNLYEQ